MQDSENHAYQSLRDFIHVDPNRHKEALPSAFSKKAVVHLKEGVDGLELERQITAAVVQVQTWVAAQGGIVGHIKTLLDGPESLWVSTTGTAPSIRRTRRPEHPGDICFYFTAIAVHVDYEAFCAAAEEAYQQCLAACFIVPAEPAGGALSDV